MPTAGRRVLAPTRLAASVLAVLLVSLLVQACSRGEPPPRAEIGADDAAAALGGRPLLSEPEERAGPSLVVPEQFAAFWTTRTGDLDAILKRRVLRMLVTYNSTAYFVDRGRQGGLSYEMGRLLEKELNERFPEGNLHVDVLFIPVTRDRLLPALVEGHGDVAVANLTVTKERKRIVDFSEPFARGVKEIVVTGPGAPRIARVEDLSGQEVHVRASSSFAESLAALNESFRKRGLDPVEIAAVDERLETEDILEMTAAGIYPITVADDHMVRLWSRVLDGLVAHPDVAVRTGTSIAVALRKDSPKLKRFLDAFVRKNRVGTLIGNMLVNRYLKNTRWIRNPAKERDLERFRSMVALFKKYGDRYDVDWLLVTAQAYQESGLDQSKRSGAGAIGVMQLLPSTAADPNVDVAHVESLENNVHAGVKYLRFLIDRYFADADMDDFDRQLFAFAAYNAGPARVAALRKEAAALGLDPNRWRGNVELVAAREIGRETVRYVANIIKYYFAYKGVVERSLDKSAARREASA
jgi:membrane-bound lytic murein transglycosylase MltF